MVRYALATDSYLVWGDESPAYTQAGTIDKNFGLIEDDITPPNPNPKTPLPSTGAPRGPVVYAEDQQEFAFDIPFHVQHADAPFHVALGSKTVTSEDPDMTPASGDEYTKTLFEEADILPTITIEHGQQTLDILQHFVGCKSSLGLTASVGESLKATMGIVAATEAHDTDAPSFANAPTIPSDEPIRFSHIQSAQFLDPDTQALVKDIVTLDSIDLSWNPGLEAVPHGGTARQAYSVVEGENAGLYDMKIGVTLDGSDFFKRAADDEALVDFEVTFARQVGTGGVVIDGAIVRLKECTVLDAPSPAPGAGRLTAEVPLGPTSTEIELRTPA